MPEEDDADSDVFRLRHRRYRAVLPDTRAVEIASIKAAQGGAIRKESQAWRGVPIAVTVGAITLPVFAQTPPPGIKTQAFEVASIKPNRSGSGSSIENTDHGRLVVTNDTVKKLIQLAFGVKDFQIEGGPGWIATERYDIVATTGKAEDIGDAELMPLLQSLLAERFALKVHSSTKEGTVYSLSVARNGPKLREHRGGGESSVEHNFRAGEGDHDRHKFYDADACQESGMVREPHRCRPYGSERRVRFQAGMVAGPDGGLIVGLRLYRTTGTTRAATRLDEGAG
jgi:uncharacterized protein DUF3738